MIYIKILTKGCIWDDIDEAGREFHFLLYSQLFFPKEQIYFYIGRKMTIRILPFRKKGREFFLTHYGRADSVSRFPIWDHDQITRLCNKTTSWIPQIPKSIVLLIRTIAWYFLWGLCICNHLCKPAMPPYTSRKKVFFQEPS